MSIRRVLVANRGEIAVRIIRACQALRLETVLAVSEADRDSLAARLADRTVCVGPASPALSYLNVGALIGAALGTGADALHPGYGFLAESAILAATCADVGITFVGPTPDQIQRMGNKLEARRLARELGIPTLPGSDQVRSLAEALTSAERIGLPIMIKAAAGGGGRGMQVVAASVDLERQLMSAAADARAAFGDDTLYLERFIPNARHVEVQVLSDAAGHIVHIGERDCSLQRRHQKLIEESPAPRLDPSLRAAIRQAGVSFARGMGYRNAGTVEFIVDQDAEAFFFLEMNTRIQVEHPVSELVSGINLVEEQFRVARGETLRFSQADVALRGHAIECRVTAESSERDFRPSPGRITHWDPPHGPNIRVDSHCYTGYLVPPFYDSLLGKVIVYGFDRAEAVERMQVALEQFSVSGVETILPFLQFAVGHPTFVAGQVSTHLVTELIDEMRSASAPRQGLPLASAVGPDELVDLTPPGAEVR